MKKDLERNGDDVEDVEIELNLSRINNLDLELEPEPNLEVEYIRIPEFMSKRQDKLKELLDDRYRSIKKYNELVNTISTNKRFFKTYNMYPIYNPKFMIFNKIYDGKKRIEKIASKLDELRCHIGSVSFDLVEINSSINNWFKDQNMQNKRTKVIKSIKRDVI